MPAPAGYPPSKLNQFFTFRVFDDENLGGGPQQLDGLSVLASPGLSFKNRPHSPLCFLPIAHAGDYTICRDLKQLACGSRGKVSCDSGYKLQSVGQIFCISSPLRQQPFTAAHLSFSVSFLWGWSHRLPGLGLICPKERTIAPPIVVFFVTTSPGLRHFLWNPCLNSFFLFLEVSVKMLL